MKGEIKNMKRYGDLINKIATKENTLDAFHRAKHGKSRYQEIRVFKGGELPIFLAEMIAKDLKNENYINSTIKYEHIRRLESGKIRDIYKIPFYPHRIIQWAILNVIQPILISKFDFHSYASIPNKGVHKALKYVKIAVNRVPDDSYVFKMDIKKFYESIDKDILIHKLHKIIKCKPTMKLLEFIVRSFKGNGLPIGNLLSQYFANLYLTDLDKYCRHTLKLKKLF